MNVEGASYGLLRKCSKQVQKPGGDVCALPALDESHSTSEFSVILLCHAFDIGTI
jgi:hypothetical protein